MPRQLNCTSETETSISTAQQLPHEVLRNIFVECLPKLVNARPSASLAPMNISHVCQLWRQVSLSSGVLWSRLRLSCSGKYRSNYYRMSIFKEILDAWLRRSRRTPLDYHIILHPDRWYEDASKGSAEGTHTAARKLVSTLLEHQGRWRIIRLHCVGVSSFPQLTVDTSNMPLLEDLDLKFTAKHRRGKKQTSIEVDVNISSSPRLESLRLESPDSFRANKSSAQNLTQCEFTFRDGISARAADTCLLLLQLAPNLHTFHAHISEARTKAEPITRGSHLVLPRLRTLYIGSPLSGISIIKKLTLPSLQNLTLDSEGFSENSSASDEVLGLICRSSPPLETLGVGADFANELHVVAYLQLLPSLRNLRIVDTSLWGHFWKTFAVNEGGAVSVLCPRLETLEVMSVLGLSGREEHVAHCLASRWDSKITKNFVIADFQDVDCEAGSIFGNRSIMRCVKEGFWLTVSGF